MIKSLLEDDANPPLKPVSENAAEVEKVETLPDADVGEASAKSFDTADSEPVFNFNLVETPAPIREKPMFQIDSKPESIAETARKSGLAYAAAITLFAAIAFLLGIGWFVDLLFGTSPWGIVVGIVLGSVVGFINFFRITSQILKDKD